MLRKREWWLIQQADISGIEPSRTNRPTYNGRLRPRRTYPLLSPLRHLSPFIGESPFRIYLRSCPPRQRLTTSNPLSHVTSFRRRVFRPHTSIIRRTWRIITPLFKSNAHEKRKRIGILFTSSCIDEFSRCGTAAGWDGGICSYVLGNHMVHL